MGIFLLCGPNLLFLLCGTFWKMRKGVAKEKENEGRGMVHGVQKKNRKRC